MVFKLTSPLVYLSQGDLSIMQIWPCHSSGWNSIASWWGSNSFTQQTNPVMKLPRELLRSHWNSLPSASHLLHINGAALVNIFSDSTCQVSSQFSWLKVSGSFYTVHALPIHFFSTLIPRNHTWFLHSSLDAPSHYPRIQSLDLFFSLFILILTTSPLGNETLNPMSTIRSLKCDPPALTSIPNFRIRFPIT